MLLQTLFNFLSVEIGSKQSGIRQCLKKVCLYNFLNTSYLTSNKFIQVVGYFKIPLSQLITNIYLLFQPLPKARVCHHLLSTLVE